VPDECPPPLGRAAQTSQHVRADGTAPVAARLPNRPSWIWVVFGKVGSSVAAEGLTSPRECFRGKASAVVRKAADRTGPVRDPRRGAADNRADHLAKRPVAARSRTSGARWSPTRWVRDRRGDSSASLPAPVRWATGRDGGLLTGTGRVAHRSGAAAVRVPSRPERLP
jgi:hypothetical protein